MAVVPLEAESIVEVVDSWSIMLSPSASPGWVGWWSTDAAERRLEDITAEEQRRKDHSP